MFATVVALDFQRITVTRIACMIFFSYFDVKYWRQYVQADHVLSPNCNCCATASERQFEGKLQRHCNSDYCIVLQ